MKKLFLNGLMLVLVNISFVACESDDEDNEPSIPWYEDTQTLKTDYMKALYEAQSPDESKISTTLMPVSESNDKLEWITVNGKKMVLVCAMLNHNSLKYWQDTDTFRLSKNTGLWVTLPQEWELRSNQYIGLDSVASRYRMIQMLGLYPDCDYDTVVEFYVDASYLFRPAADPTITTTTCGMTFPSSIDKDYTVGITNFMEWFAYQKSIAYEGDYACPWTQLGYTYDWHHDAPRQGLSEYIATVKSLAKVKTRQGSWTFIQKRTH